MKDTFKKSLMKNRWDGIKMTEPHEFTNDAIVSRWKEETGKWLAVRKENLNLKIKSMCVGERNTESGAWQNEFWSYSQGRDGPDPSCH